MITFQLLASRLCLDQFIIFGRTSSLVVPGILIALALSF